MNIAYDEGRVQEIVFFLGGQACPPEQAGHLSKPDAGPSSMCYTIHGCYNLKLNANNFKSFNFQFLITINSDTYHILIRPFEQQ